MHDIILNVSLAVVVTTYLLSFFLFDRLLRLESLAYPERWRSDGRPIGVFTLTKARRGYDLASLLSFLRLYVVWNFHAPPWVRGDCQAARLMWGVRSSLLVTVGGLYTIRETLM